MIPMLAAVAAKFVLPVAVVLNIIATGFTIAAASWEVWAPAANTLLLILLTLLTHGNKAKVDQVERVVRDARPEIEAAGRITKEVGAIIRETRPRSAPVSVVPDVTVPQGSPVTEPPGQ